MESGTNIVGQIRADRHISVGLDNDRTVVSAREIIPVDTHPSIVDGYITPADADTPEHDILPGIGDITPDDVDTTVNTDTTQMMWTPP